MIMRQAILVAGGTGLVGREVIKYLLASGHCAIALVRRGGRGALETLGAGDALRILEVDFDALGRAQPEVSALAPTGLVCALGTTIRKAGTQAAFAKVDRDYVAAFAALGRAAGAHHFALVSSVGADARSSAFYLRTKGEAEAAVGACGYRRVDIARPSFILGRRTETRSGERLGFTLTNFIAPLLLGPLKAYRPIPASIIARALVNLGARDEPGVFIHHFGELVAAGAMAQKLST